MAATHGFPVPDLRLSTDAAGADLDEQDMEALHSGMHGAGMCLQGSGVDCDCIECAKNGEPVEPMQLKNKPPRWHEQLQVGVDMMLAVPAPIKLTHCSCHILPCNWS